MPKVKVAYCKHCKNLTLHSINGTAKRGTDAPRKVECIKCENDLMIIKQR